MRFSTGYRLGVYEIVSPLGAGGMGEVYRARDTRLDRPVAIKVLNAAIAEFPDLAQRFEREARTISQLQHPHICTLYDVGRENGTEYLVIEFLEGDTLADRLAKGPLPLDQLLKVAIQIADALDHAHRAGIVHRDLKPGNVMLTKSGAKLLDFGLAKPRPAGTAPGMATAPLLVSAAPTMTGPSPSPLTTAGSVLGTIQYMSPEQLQGHEADARSDMFAFGAMLYEMATGQRAFGGKTQIKVASAILEDDPIPLTTAAAAMPKALEYVVRMCLAKDPNDRFQSAHDVKLQLQWIAQAVPAPQPAAVSRSRPRTELPWSVAGIALLALTSALLVWQPWRSSPEPNPIHVRVQPGAAVAFNTTGPVTFLTLSPDATRVAFVGIDGVSGSPRLYVRALDQLQALPLADTEDARDPFFSPDGQWLGFFSHGKLKKVAASGGSVITLADASNSRGGTWTETGDIVFAADAVSGLVRVSSNGGSPELLTTLDTKANEISHRFPQALPGARAVLFAAHGVSFSDAAIDVVSLDTRQVSTISRTGGFFPRYVAGYLTYVRDGTVFAAPFDVQHLQVTGNPMPILESVGNNPGSGVAHIAVSERGTVLYSQGVGAGATIEWMDPTGRFQPLRETSANYVNPALSPDGKRLAYEVREQKLDIWIDDLERQTATRFTFDGNDVSPTWTPDARRITYFRLGVAEVGAAGLRREPGGLFWKRADGSGDAQRLTESDTPQTSPAWRPDGKVLAFQQQASNRFTIMTLTVDGDEATGWHPGKPKPFLDTPFNEITPAFSPDGRWLAYASNESGAFEVYVRPYPGPGAKVQVSNGGCCQPRWSRRRNELLYRTNDQKLMVVGYQTTADAFIPDRPRLWSPGQFMDRGNTWNYDLHPDGDRVVVFKTPSNTQSDQPNMVNLIFNFSEELRRKVAGK